GQRPELALADDVRERLARRPAGDERGEVPGRRLRQRAPRRDDQADARRVERAREQHLGVGARLRHAGRRQAGDRRRERVAHRHQGRRCTHQPAAASASVCWRVTSASTIGSISPSSTRSRVWRVTLTRWSVTRLWGKLYVRIFSERSPEPTMALRLAAISLCCSLRARSRSRARGTVSAFDLFLCCDFSSWQVTTSPVGRCVTRTAESVVLTLCPPGPEER